MSIVKTFIVWLFLNRLSYSSVVFSYLSSMITFSIMLVFLFPCRPISSLSSKFSSKNGCLSLFSVMSMCSVSLLFRFYHLPWFLFTSTKHFVVSCISSGLSLGGIIVTGEPVINFWPWLRIAAGPFFFLYPVYRF